MSDTTYTADSRDILSYTLPEMTDALAALGLPKFRAAQLYRWLHVQLAERFEDCANLPKELRERLAGHFSLRAPRLLERQVSKEDGTQKFLFAMEDGQTVESVFMRYRFGNSVCISSQVGCRMGCRFCASTLDGLVRGLAPSEMLGQIYAIRRLTGEKVTHVVVMGTGEPLDNYAALVRFLHLLTDENGQNLSQRNITVSTCGIAPRIRELADERFSITLALSLHAPSDEKRRRIMPIAERYTIAELMAACRYYYERTRRQVTFEYSLIRGVNDTREDAAQLSALARPLRAHVNLIPVNPVRERAYAQPSRIYVLAFKKELEKNGINVTIRRELGRDIDGACGQLRHRKLQRD